MANGPIFAVRLDTLSRAHDGNGAVVRATCCDRKKVQRKKERLMNRLKLCLKKINKKARAKSRAEGDGP